MRVWFSGPRILGGLVRPGVSFGREDWGPRRIPAAYRTKAHGVRMGRKPKLTDHQRHEAIKRRDHGEDTLAEIGR